MILIAFGILFVLFIGITIVLLILSLIFKKKIFGKIILGLWLFFISIPILYTIESIFTTRKEIEKNDIYGSYVINRNKCEGKQADWQYNHFRFKITEDNKIFFYITEKENIIKTIEGTVEFNHGNTSPQIKLNFEAPKFHVLLENPTLYREIWSFYYVFESNKYGNMFFTKGNWKSID